jgi:hypothetical protein
MNRPDGKISWRTVVGLVCLVVWATAIGIGCGKKEKEKEMETVSVPAADELARNAVLRDCLVPPDLGTVCVVAEEAGGGRVKYYICPMRDNRPTTEWYVYGHPDYDSIEELTKAISAVSPRFSVWGAAPCQWAPGKLALRPLTKGEVDRVRALLAKIVATRPR